MESRPTVPTQASKTFQVAGSLRQCREHTRRFSHLLSPKQHSTLGFWNLQRSIQPEAERITLSTILSQHKLSLCGVAGSWKWTTGQHDCHDHTILWSGTEGKGHGYGVGLTIANRDEHCLKSWEAVSNRLLWARFEGTIKLSIVVAYAPTSDKKEDRKDFFLQLEKLLHNIPGMDFVVVLGDFNSQVGSANTTKDGYGSLGCNGIGDCNDSGEELLQFCVANRLAITNTFFKHKAARKYTWTSPNRSKHCLDYVLTRRQWLSSFTNVRVRRSANSEWSISDHELLTCTIRLKLKPPKPTSQQPPTSHNRSALYDEETKAQYLAEVRRQLSCHTSNTPKTQPQPTPASSLNQHPAPPTPITADEQWQHLANAMTSAAETCIPRVPLLKPHKPYISNKTLTLVAERRTLIFEAQQSGTSLRNPSLKAKLKKLRHKITRQIRDDKKKHAAANAKQAQKLAAAGNPHAFFGFISKLGGTNPNTQSSNAHLPPNQQAEVFRQHFEQVLQCGQPAQPEALASIATNPNPSPWPLPTITDTVEAVKRLKHWRAADADGVYAELLQKACCDTAFLTQLHNTILTALQHGMPAVVKQSMLLPLHKKGDKADPNNYRGIQIISMLRKLLALIISKPLCALAEEKLLEYQCGFRPQRSCADQIFTLRMLSEEAITWQQRLYCGFVDLQKAFDSVPREALWAVLRKQGIPEQIISILRDMHTDTICRVRIGTSFSNSFGMHCGVQQGCPLANPLFNLYMDWVVKEALAACQNSGVTVHFQLNNTGHLHPPKPNTGTPLQIPLLMLADDLSVLASNPAALQQFITEFDTACRRWGLIINTKKTEVMLIGGAAATACEVCNKQHPESSMLLCDGCNTGWHMHCLQPPLPKSPEGTWHCPTCASSSLPPTDPHRPAIIVQGQPLKWVEQFKYLGSQFHQNGSLTPEIKYRIQLAATAFQRLHHPFFKQQHIRLRTRMQAFDSLVTSVLLYGSESWAFTADTLRPLRVFHHRCLRMMIGVTLRHRMENTELYRRCHTTDIATQIQARQLGWLGHLGRMADDRLAKQVLYSTMSGEDRRRRRGSPGASLRDGYTKLLAARVPNRFLRREYSMNNWLKACQDRRVWQDITKTVTRQHHT